jgi:hypothetical protein
LEDGLLDGVKDGSSIGFELLGIAKGWEYGIVYRFEKGLWIDGFELSIAEGSEFSIKLGIADGIRWRITWFQGFGIGGGTEDGLQDSFEDGSPIGFELGIVKCWEDDIAYGFEDGAWLGGLVVSSLTLPKLQKSMHQAIRHSRWNRRWISLGFELGINTGLEDGLKDRNKDDGYTKTE